MFSSSSTIKRLEIDALRGLLHTYASRFTASVTYQMALTERTIEAALDDPDLIDGHVDHNLFRHMHRLFLADQEKVRGKADSGANNLPTVLLF
jgi:hypothetical protein